MIRIGRLWLCTQSQDMRDGADRLLNIVVNAVGAARAHHGYLCSNLRAARIKLHVHDGFGMWCATRRLQTGRFVWLEHSPGQAAMTATLRLSAPQFEAVVVGLPWQRLGELIVIMRS